MKKSIDFLLLFSFLLIPVNLCLADQKTVTLDDALYQIQESFPSEIETIRGVDVDNTIHIFRESFNESWRDASIIYDKIYRPLYLFWKKNFEWRIFGIWDKNRGKAELYLEENLEKIKEEVEREKEEMQERIKQETRDAGKRLSESIWNKIKETFWFNRKEAQELEVVE